MVRPSPCIRIFVNDLIINLSDIAGVAIISQIGFLKTVEECFNTITRNRGVIDKPLLDIKALADHFHKIKYVNVANSKPSSGPVQSVGWDPSYSDTEDSMSLKKLGLISSPFAAEGRAEADRKHKITLHEAGRYRPRCTIF